MQLPGAARRTVASAIRWDRRNIGAAALVPARVRSRIRRFFGMGALQDARRFWPDHVDKLFETLHEGRAVYVVLRWFDALPERADGDIDFLIADESLGLFKESLDEEHAGVPCDLYSASGAKGYRYAGMPYYPPLLSQRMLDRRVMKDGLVAVPCPEDHFLSLAYHAIYQKGLRAGLATADPSLSPAAMPTHDYHGTLERLASTLRLNIGIEMEELDAFLASRGWRPPIPMLKKLALNNQWLRSRLERDGFPHHG